MSSFSTSVYTRIPNSRITLNFISSPPFLKAKVAVLCAALWGKTRVNQGSGSDILPVTWSGLGGAAAAAAACASALDSWHETSRVSSLAATDWRGLIVLERGCHSNPFVSCALTPNTKKKKKEWAVSLSLSRRRRESTSKASRSRPCICKFKQPSICVCQRKCPLPYSHPHQCGVQFSSAQPVAMLNSPVFFSPPVAEGDINSQQR